MRNINDSRYEQFDTAERFSLTISALARNDLKEADRLLDTCPRFHYKVIDFEYFDRIFTINIITLLFFQKCVYQYNVIKMAENYLILIARMEPAWEDQKKALDKRDLHISQLKALYQGLRLFCSHIGINSDDFLKTIPNHVCFDIDEYLSSGIEASKEDIERAKNIFLEHWPS